MKQTAVSKVISQLCTLFALKKLAGIDEAEFFNRLKDVEQNALRMEKEQIIKAHLNARCYDSPNSFDEAEQYYTNTYGQ